MSFPDTRPVTHPDHPGPNNVIWTDPIIRPDRPYIIIKASTPEPGTKMPLPLIRHLKTFTRDAHLILTSKIKVSPVNPLASARPRTPGLPNHPAPQTTKPPLPHSLLNRYLSYHSISLYIYYYIIYVTMLLPLYVLVINNVYNVSNKPYKGFYSLFIIYKGYYIEAVEFIAYLPLFKLIQGFTVCHRDSFKPYPLRLSFLYSICLLGHGFNDLPRPAHSKPSFKLIGLLGWPFVQCECVGWGNMLAAPLVNFKKHQSHQTSGYNWPYRVRGLLLCLPDKVESQWLAYMLAITVDPSLDMVENSLHNASYQTQPLELQGKKPID